MMKNQSRQTTNKTQSSKIHYEEWMQRKTNGIHKTIQKSGCREDKCYEPNITYELIKVKIKDLIPITDSIVTNVE